MQVVEIFKTLCHIPHCSHRAEAMQRYLCAFAKERGYHVAIDDVGNILCSHTNAKVTLQAHYDMVCIGEYETMELEEVVIGQKRHLRAKNSTLGADNGIGMAMILYFMEKKYPIDALFTADEEVGLLGARGLTLELTTPYLLNLDAEEEGIVTIGCAGGVDMLIALPITRSLKKGSMVAIEKSGYVGGHSGVDIHLDIPNAIKELSKVCRSDLIEINGGERRNAIAKRAVAKLFSSEGEDDILVINESKAIVEALESFKHGVYSFDEALNIVQSSANLAIIETKEDVIELHVTLRSMQKEDLDGLIAQTRHFFTHRFSNAEVIQEGYYAPWKPEVNSFNSRVLESSKRVFKHKAAFGAIHAGLECGILGEKFADIQMASIGPNIHYPHSTRESVELDSIERVLSSIEDLLENL